jgi:hypothetical protein
MQYIPSPSANARALLLSCPSQPTQPFRDDDCEAGIEDESDGDYRR